MYLPFSLSSRTGGAPESSGERHLSQTSHVGTRIRKIETASAQIRAIRRHDRELERRPLLEGPHCMATHERDSSIEYPG
jgi:hypothetical protein